MGSSPTPGAMVTYHLEQDNVYSSFYIATEHGTDGDIWTYWVWMRLGGYSSKYVVDRLYCDSAYEEPVVCPDNWWIV